VTPTVVPTKATVELARAMIAEARRQESGAEAVILRYDDCHPEQLAALVGLLLEHVACDRQCRECRAWSQYAKGLCMTCWQRERRRNRPKLPCADCGQVKRLHAAEKCQACYARAYRARAKESAA